ncbi:MAG: class II fructose-bisphosphate aldolase [Candidatus Pacebacteria bacterium]|jgi:fructose-bisphosphate aldolase class II|nr:class II fructose-bisphosphate aldolase [Candidatus Paceibacterota bacterium]
MKTLRECIHDAVNNQVALGHFNISNIEGFWAVVEAAKVVNVPVIIGVSEGERDFIGLLQIVALVKSVREETGQLVYLNADHTYSFERARTAIDAGFDMVIFDGAKLPDEENIRITKQCVEYARASGRDVLVEAELGFIGSGSDIKKEIPVGAVMKTDPEVARQFVEKTGVDLFAPAVGNIHGIIRPVEGTYEERIDIPLVRHIRKSCGVPLVLHGGSGLPAEDFIDGIDAGLAIIHISTELREAYTEALKSSLAEHPTEITPYKITMPARSAMQKIVEEKLKLFNK